jgi:hypothetical protein
MSFKTPLRDNIESTFMKNFANYVRTQFEDGKKLKRLYDITDHSISVDRGLYGPISIQEVFTFNS